MDRLMEKQCKDSLTRTVAIKTEQGQTPIYPTHYNLVVKVDL